MENALVNIKQEWNDVIKSHILSQGFQETEFGYEKIRIAREPGQTISINGRIMQQPGKEIKIKQLVCVQGDGWVADMDESNKVEFTQIKFETYQGNDLVMQYEEAFYWDNPNYFIELFNKAFK
jgi:hypothetical protein